MAKFTYSEHALAMYCERILGIKTNVISGLHGYINSIMLNGTKEFLKDRGVWRYKYLDNVLIVSEDNKVITIYQE